MNLLVATLLAVVAVASSNVLKPKGSFELLILHNNDMHAHFEQSSQRSGTCTNDDREAGKCYGGFPRVAHVVKEARAAALNHTGPPVLYLNAGDTYTGTAWFTIYKWKIAAEFVNALQPDAVSLGNHEFDQYVEGVVPFIQNLTAPVLAANLVLDKVPSLQNLKNLKKSIIIEIDKVKLGIIGYLTPETKTLAPGNDVEYEDEIVALRREVQKLREQNVNIVIALGHSGYERDIEIAKSVEGLDIVVGGHTHTFLSNEKNISEVPETVGGDYPTEVQVNGRKVRVVQAYCNNKYLGRLHLVFDSNGEITHCDGAPILLNKDIPEDDDLVHMLEARSDEINKLIKVVVGNTSVNLEQSMCRFSECNLGNFVADVILNYTREEHHDVDIAIVQGGDMRSPILQDGGFPFNITQGDWLNVLQYSGPLHILTMNGTVLKEALEHSVSQWSDKKGKFLQVSGIEVVYDLARPVGNRVVQAKAVCSQCGHAMRDVNNDDEYKVIMPAFIARQGDGYEMFANLPKTVLPYNELHCAVEYSKKYSPIYKILEDRIILRNTDKAKEVENSQVKQ
nr:protein 5NUC isoform X5 [Helicoverpa armigera]